MSSIQDLNIKIGKLKAQYNMTKNENTKIDLLKKIEDTKKELNALKIKEGVSNGKKKVIKEEVKEEPKKPEKPQEPPKGEGPKGQEPKEPQKPDRPDDMNRGKVAEPGSSIPDKKPDKPNNGKNNRN